MTGRPPLDPAARAGMARTLEAAAARLRDKGWQRGHSGPAEGPNCIMGAVELEAGLHMMTQRSTSYWEAVWNGIPRPLPARVTDSCGRPLSLTGPEHVTTWNDYVCPDGATAVDALLGAAKAIAGEEAP